MEIFKNREKLKNICGKIPILENVFLTGRNDARFILAALPEEMLFSKHGNSGGALAGKTHFQKCFLPGDHLQEIIVFQYGENLTRCTREKSFSNTRIIWIAGKNRFAIHGNSGTGNGKSRYWKTPEDCHAWQEKAILENMDNLARENLLEILSGRTHNLYN